MKLVMQTTRSIIQTVHHASEFIKFIGVILNYLFVDSHRYDTIFKMFLENTQLMPNVILVVNQHEKLDALSRSYAKDKTGAISHVPLFYCKALFKILTNQCEVGKSIFLQSQDGISTLKSFLNTFRSNPTTYEQYLYCLGMIPSLLTLSNNFNEDFIDAGYISLLSRQLISFYEEDNQAYIGMVTPLLLALKALVTASPEMKEELKVNIALLNVLYSAVSSSYGNRSHTAHMHIAGTILMCELGHDVFTTVIRDRLSEMQTTLESAKENKKVH